MKRSRWPFPTLCVCLVGLYLALFGFPGKALPAEIPVHQFARDHWGQQQGMPGGVVKRLFQLSDGYLWLHTGAGLVRFDGARFVSIQPNVKGQDSGEPILAMARDPQRRLMVQRGTQTLVMENGRFAELARFDLPDGTLREVFRARNGDFWLGADNQIYRYRNGQLKLMVMGCAWTFGLIEDSKGQIWVPSQGGLFCFDGERAKLLPSLGSQPPKVLVPCDMWPTPKNGPTLITAIMEDGEGSFWVGSELGMWKLKNGRLFRNAQTQGCQDVHVSCLLKDRQGNLWVGTEFSGLRRLAAGTWSAFRREDGLTDDCVQSLVEDREGSLWIGTRSGLDRLRVGALRTLGIRDGLGSENIGTVLAAKDGTIYASTANTGIARIRKGKVDRLTREKDGLPTNGGGCLLEAPDGVIWLGTGSGLGRIQGDRVEVLTAQGKLTGSYIPSLASDDQGLILGLSDLHAYRYRNDRLFPFDFPMEAPAPNREAVRYLWAMHRDQEGNLWMATSTGLYRLGKGEPPEKARLTNFRQVVNSISEDDQGFLWIAGTSTSGFTRIRKSDGSVVRFTPQMGARVEGIGRILADRVGNLWIGTNNGIAFFYRSELDAVAEARANHLEMVLYGVMDGLVSQECGLISAQPAAYRAPDGCLYFASRKGLVVIDPEHLPRNPLVPPVCIEEVVVDGQVQPEGKLIVSPGAERIEIHYTALSLRVPSRVRFKYQLEGYDSDWVEAGARRTAFYSKLPPGKYVLKVMACNDDGLWNLQGAQLEFVQKARFVQTFWFLLLVLMGVGTLIWGLFLLRTRHLIRRQAELEQMVSQRTLALQAYQENLEKLVQERTAELQSTNEQLQVEIRERRSSEEQLRQVQKLESIGRLAGGVAHDFNNLLTIIDGYCNLLDETLVEGEPREFAGEIRKAGNKASALTRQLLAFSRKQILQPVEMDLNALVQDMEKMLGRLVREDVDLKVHLSDHPCFIKADPGQINQVILNLAVNARDAMPNGGSLMLETACVQLDASEASHPIDIPPGAYVRLTVSDTGTGMDQATLDKIFEPFFTTKERGKGTGLGLSTVFGIVKQSGGHIWTYSEVGQGTTFKLYFPRILEPTCDEPEFEEAVTRGGGEILLVVEDQEEVRNLVLRTLKHLGYFVLSAENGEEALKVSRAFPGTIHLLFTDVVMPGMNGRELGGILQRERPELRVVYTTGYTEDVIIQRGALEPGQTLLQKPFTSTSLAACIAEALKRR